MKSSDLETISDTLTSDFDDFWNVNILKEELLAVNSHYLVAISDNEILGFAGIKAFLEEADIMNIVVKKSYRNQGIGTLLLENLIQLAISLDLTSITLEVNEENLSAIHLYQKFGFNQIGIRKNYYQNKNGLIMRTNLAEAKRLTKN